MKSLIASLRPRFPSGRTTLASLALICTAALLCLAAASGPPSEQGLAGSWQVTVAPGDGSPSFQSLLTYGSDGVLTGVDASAPPSMVTAAHGAWIRKGAHTFRFTLREFFFDLDGAIFGSPGVYTVKISETLALEHGGQAYNGEWTGEIFDAAGNVVAPIGGTSHAERIVVAE